VTIDPQTTTDIDSTTANATRPPIQRLLSCQPATESGVTLEGPAVPLSWRFDLGRTYRSRRRSDRTVVRQPKSTGEQRGHAALQIGFLFAFGAAVSHRSWRSTGRDRRQPQPMYLFYVIGWPQTFRTVRSGRTDG